jgi:ribosomal protein S12
MVLLSLINSCFPCFFYYFTLNIMPTIQQLVRSARQKMTNKTKAALKSCPQRRAFVLVFTHPKKKLSFTKVARVRLTTGFVVTAYIPGMATIYKNTRLS